MHQFEGPCDAFRLECTDERGRQHVFGACRVQYHEDSLVFHAGTTLKEGKVVTNGGRVMAITSFGSDFKTALSKSYENVAKLSFEGMNYRKDLGFDL